MSTIVVSKPSDEIADLILEELRAEFPPNENSGFSFETIESRNFGPELVEAFVLGVASGVTANRIGDLAQFTITRFIKHKYHGVQFCVTYNSQKFKMPAELKQLQKAIAENKSSE